ncbi:MAG: MarR family winged helix-turn-helix transcriptional regulator [Acutalibacteraceae bacterium]
MSEPNYNLTLLRLLHQCAHRINMSSKYPGQGRLLVLLHKKGTLTQRELIEITQRRSATLSEQLAGMEKAGYITRTKNPLDNRNIDVSLTVLGEQAAIEAEQARAELADHVFGTLQERRKDAVRNYTIKAISNTLFPLS